jgi:anti-sigma factor RsiW
MAERTFNPNSTACGQWEMLLADALDGLLKPGDEATFTAHKAVCPACAALFEEARRGREWLEFLSPEPEVPAGLLDKILAHTGPGQAASYRLATAGGNVVPIRPVSVPAWQRPGLVAHVQRFAQPRLLMTAAMAFFSIALTLNITGVRLANLRISDLRPSMMRSYMERQLAMASTPIIRYYDHSRLAYEVQSTVRELRQTTGVGGQGEGEDNRLKLQDLAPGQSRQAPAPGNGGQWIDPPQQPGSLTLAPALQPALNDAQFLDTSLTFQQRPALSSGSRKETRERSTRWIA